MVYLDTETFGLNTFAPEVWKFTKENKMTYTLKIKNLNPCWSFEIYRDESIFAVGGFNSAEEALEAGSKKLLGLLPKETFDFGKGPVPAHKHLWGGGWVADTAHVDERVYVGPDACVYEFAKVCGCVHISDNARIYGRSEIYGFASVRENAHVHSNARVFEFAQIYGDANVSTIVCGYSHINTNNEKYVLVNTQTLGCFGPFNSPGEASKAILPGISYKIRTLEKS